MTEPKRKPRRGKQAAGWEENFLKALADTGNVLRACEIAGCSRASAYEKRKADESFARRWNDALETACDALEDEARKRALKRSDLLLIFLLKAYRPHLFREQMNVGIQGQFAHLHLSQPEERNKEVITRLQGAAEVWQTIQQNLQEETSSQAPEAEASHSPSRPLLPAPSQGPIHGDILDADNKSASERVADYWREHGNQRGESRSATAQIARRLGY